MVYEDGSMYEGSFLNGSQEGHGLWRLVDGSTFEGHWKAGVAEGPGMLMLPDGTIFEASFTEGLCEGPARVTLPDGRAVELHYDRNRRASNCRITTSQHNSYEVECPESSSLLRLPQLKQILANQIAKRKRIPYDKEKGTDDERDVVPDPSRSKERDRAMSLSMSNSGEEAPVEQVLKVTINKFVSKNGDEYEGEWENGKKHGKGTYKYCNGRVYEGSFKNGKKHGFGTYTFSDGSK